jgi:hypothetical protein
MGFFFLGTPPSRRLGKTIRAGVNQRRAFTGGTPALPGRNSVIVTEDGQFDTLQQKICGTRRPQEEDPEAEAFSSARAHTVAALNTYFKDVFCFNSFVAEDRLDLLLEVVNDRDRDPDTPAGGDPNARVAAAALKALAAEAPPARVEQLSG